MNVLRTCLFVTVAALPTRALAAPGEDQAPRAEADRDPAVAGASPAVWLELSTEDADPAFTGPLRAALVDLLDARERPVVEDAEILLEVSVTLDPHDPGTYRTRVAGSAPGLEPFTPVVEPCQRCGSTQLIAQLERQLDAALDHTDATKAGVAESTAEPKPPTIVTPPPPTPPKKSHLSGMGIAGIALLGTGFAATAAGAGLWARGSLPDPDRPDWVLRTRPPGIAMVAAGAAGMVTGSVLLAVDLRRKRSSQHAVAPLLAPGVAGVTFGGRF